MLIKHVVSIGPEKAKESLTADEFHALVATVDKLLQQDIKLEISYTEIPTAIPQL